MVDRKFSFAFVLSGIDHAISKIGLVNKKLKDQTKNAKDIKIAFGQAYKDARDEGNNMFKSLGIGTKRYIKGLGGIVKTLVTISRIGMGGIVAFLASKAFQYNLGGITTLFYQVSGAISRMMGELNIAIIDVFKNLTPLISVLTKFVSGVLMWFISGITSMIKDFTKLPSIIKIVTAAVVGLGAAFWAASANPLVFTLATLAAILIGVYKAIKWIIGLFKKNSHLTMNIDTKYNGMKFNGINTSRINTDNSIKTINNNISINGSGNSYADGQTIADILSRQSVFANTT